MQVRTRHNTPNVDAPLRIFLAWSNLRDSIVEDNVRKRPFSVKIRLTAPLGLRVGYKVTELFRTKQGKVENFSFPSVQKEKKKEKAKWIQEKAIWPDYRCLVMRLRHSGNRITRVQ